MAPLRGSNERACFDYRVVLKLYSEGFFAQDLTLLLVERALISPILTVRGIVDRVSTYIGHPIDSRSMETEAVRV